MDSISWRIHISLRGPEANMVTQALPAYYNMSCCDILPLIMLVPIGPLSINITYIKGIVYEKKYILVIDPGMIMWHLLYREPTDRSKNQRSKFFGQIKCCFYPLLI